MQGQCLAHTGTVAAVAHEDERQPRTFGAHLAQQVEAIDSGQFARGDDQVGFAGQRTQGLRAVGADLQPGITAHAQQHFAEHVAYPGVALDNQYAWWGGVCSVHRQLLNSPDTQSVAAS
ncbi:hypothetical protein D3C81_1545600 [compost metagenome]